MRTLTWSIAAILLVGLTARGQDQPNKDQVERSKGEKVERLKATEAYYRKAGKTQAAEFYQGKADLASKPTRIYVPVIKSDRLARDEALRLTELLSRSIERDTPSRVVGSPDEADLILEATLKPVAQPKP